MRERRFSVVSRASMRPLLMMMTREQVISTSGKMWVESKIV
jgi:hypothetical protein